MVKYCFKGVIMTCGIYILYYECDDGLFYIGKSFNIESRVKEHQRNLKQGAHYNKGLSKGYALYGTPNYDVLEVLPHNDSILFKREIHWIATFNSFHNGMNETIGGSGWGLGEDRPNSKYTNEQVVEVLNILVDSPEKTFREVSLITSVSTNTIASISSGFSYTWLKEKYPKKYSILESLIGTRRSNRSSANSRGIRYPLLLSPIGEVFKVTNVAEFARKHKLGKEHLGKVLKGIERQHKGWKICQEEQVS